MRACAPPLPLRTLRSTQRRARVQGGGAARALPEGSAPEAAAPPAAASPAAAAATAPAAPAWKWEDSDDALWSYAALFGILGLGAIPAAHTTPLADLPYFIGLASVTIYVGAHRAVTNNMRQQISIREGLLAPVALSFSLFGLYLLLKYTTLDLQTFLNAYFWLLASLALGGAAVPLLGRVGDALGQPKWEFKVPEGLLLNEEGDPVTEASLKPSAVAGVALALGVTTWDALHHSGGFTMNNLVACLVATELLMLLGVRSFRAAALLLVGLLCYDVFWVFGSPGVVGDNVMLAVATSDAVTGPTRLLFPRIPCGGGEAAAFPFSLLGLGDVALPGLLAALALRYDASRSTDMRARAAAAAEAIQDALAGLEPGASRAEMGNAAATAALEAYDRVADREQRQRDMSQGVGASSGSGSGGESGGGGEGGGEFRRMPVSDALLVQRPTFTAAMVAYMVGLGAAFYANSATGLGQPALLYIVPAMLGALVISGASRSELGRLWAFTDVPSWKPKPK